MELFQGLEPYVYDLLGINVEPRSLSPLQVCARAVVIYLIGLAIMRIGENRFLGRHTAFDIILAFLLGALLSRTVNGSSPFFGSIVAVALLVGLHWFLAWASLNHPRFSGLLRGQPTPLVQEGNLDEKKMRRHLVGRADLREAVRLAGHRGEEEVWEAFLERNGSISIVPRKTEGEPSAGGSDAADGKSGEDGEEEEHGKAGRPEPQHRRQPRILEVRVEEGVQTVRLQLE